ncbi:ester cyclase [bacterium]|nr:ester cyclase [bacterium]
MGKKELIDFANKELFEKENLDIIPDVFTTDYVTHTANKEYKGHDFIKRWVKQLRKAMPNICVEKVEFFIQEKNTVVWQRTLKGKHTTQMWGVKPSEKNIKWNEMVVSRFENDKIIEEWVVSELIGELLSKPPMKK